MRASHASRSLCALLALSLAHCGDDPAPPGTGGGGGAAGAAGGAGGTGGTGGTGGAGGMSGGCVEGPAPVAVAGFRRTTVDADAAGAAYASAGDINGDGRTDLVVSRIGPVTIDGGQISLSRAQVTVHLQGEGMRCWEKIDVIRPEDGLYFPGESALRDIDGDGDLDIMLAFGFFVCQFDPAAGPCGALLWLEQAPSGWIRHDIVPAGDTSFYHRATLVDLDGDGVDDLVTVAETQASGVARWYKGDGSADRFEATPREIGGGAGSFPSVVDIDGDGDLDVASAAFFAPGAAYSWFERTADPSPGAPAGAWVQHVINDDSGRGFELEIVPDLLGDGVTRALATNHVNTANNPPDPVESAVLLFDIPPDPTVPWPKTVISTGIASRPDEGLALRDAPGVVGHGDVDGDGDLDVVVAGDGDARTFWLEQTQPGAFVTHVIEDSLGQAGGALVVDLDGDGRNEVVFTGYEDNVVYVYSRE